MSERDDPQGRPPTSGDDLLRILSGERVSSGNPRCDRRPVRQAAGGARSTRKRRKHPPFFVYGQGGVIELGSRRQTAPLDAFLLRSGGSGMEVEDTGSHRVAIAELIGKPRKGRHRLITWAVLVAEPGNPASVVVQIEGHDVGRLPAEVATAITPVLARLSAARRVAHCRADTYGGGGRDGFDVWLYFADAAAQLGYLDRYLEGEESSGSPERSG